MLPNFKQKRVFLDTEVFVGEGFNFNSTKLSEIRRLSSSGDLLVVMPTVTVSECKRRIEKMIRAARNLLKEKTMRHTLGILQQTHLDGAFPKELDAKLLAAEVEGKFDEYLMGCKAVICPSSGISAETVLDAYFAGKPPFGQDQKKDQFPDAVAVFALAAWQSSDGHPIHVISNDNDLVSACTLNPQLVVHKGLSEFLDLHNKEAEEQATFVQDLISKNLNEIVKQIEQKFSELGFILLEEDGDVEDVTVDEVDIGQPSIVALHDEYADVEIEVTVHFTADVTYEDTDTGWWDSEDGVYYGMETVSKSIEREKTFTAQVELGWDSEEQSDVDVVLGLRDVEVRLHERDSHYR